MNIAICDDDKNIREILSNNVKTILEEMNINYSITEFENGYDLIPYTQKIDLILLDVEMENGDGFEVKRNIENHKYDTIIIYVTSHDEYAIDTHGLNVIGFINKKDLNKKLPGYLIKAAEIKNQNQLFIENIDIDTIGIIKSAGVYVYIYTFDRKKILHRESMEHISECLSNRNFFRIQRSYLINFKYIEKVVVADSRRKYAVCCGMKVPISRGVFKKFNEAYLEYRRRNYIY